MGVIIVFFGFSARTRFATEAPVIALRSIPAFVRFYPTKAGMKRSVMTENSFAGMTKNDTKLLGEILTLQQLDKRTLPEHSSQYRRLGWIGRVKNR